MTECTLVDVQGSMHWDNKDDEQGRHFSKAMINGFSCYDAFIRMVQCFSEHRYKAMRYF
jgi:hypothetical protein